MSRSGRRGAMASGRRRTTAGSPAFVTSAKGNDEATGNNLTSVITVPGTVASGHVMVVVGTQNTGTATMTISGGGSGATWTRRQGPNTINSLNARANLWTARATGSSASSTITVTSNESKRFPALLLVFSGVTETGILTAVTVVDVIGTSHTFPSVTVPSPGGYLLAAVAAMRSASATVSTFSGGEPAGVTLDAESNTAAPASPNFTVSGFHKSTTVAAGSQSPGTATSKNAADGTNYGVKGLLYSIAMAPA